jgi:colanic acid/amylovoran biosynthesis protein
MSDGPLFILAGNGAYPNRGCEAVALGTIKIIREQYPEARFLCISHFKQAKELEDQRRNETDAGVEHLSSFHPSRQELLSSFYRPSTWAYVYRSLLDEKRLGRSVYRDIVPRLQEAKAVLSIASDNYSLYHGTARFFTSLDDLVLSAKRPLVLWGASIGPFDQQPRYEAFMSRHLKKATGIFARESATVEYLEGIGVTDNVHRAADPSFLMDKTKPEGIENIFPIYDDAIGLNLSPRLADHVTGGDMEKWTKMAGVIISAVATRTRRPVLLIPHGTRACADDHAFMKRALAHTYNKDQVALLPPDYTAAETKWVIGRMDLFVGSRTHAIIDALSCGVPTLSLGYGMKTAGINRDAYGHERYRLVPKDVTSRRICDRIMSMLAEVRSIRSHLNTRSRELNESAMSAGATLKELLEKQ